VALVIEKLTGVNVIMYFEFVRVPIEIGYEPAFEPVYVSAPLKTSEPTSAPDVTE
jgi:hypothetical protein